MALSDGLKILEDAFPLHPIDPTAAFADWGTTYVDAERFRSGSRGKQWTELTAQFLEFHHDALVFLGPNALPEFLPAYLSVFVRGDQVLNALPSFLLGILTRSNDDARFDARFAEFTPEQRAAVCRVLVSYERYVEGSGRQADVTVALDSYWRTLANGGDE